MDRLTERKQLVRALLTEVAEIRMLTSYPMRNLLLFDDEHAQYMVCKYGWKGENHMYGMIAHLEVAPNAKIWVHHDGTGLDLVLKLEELGITADQIVLAFLPEIMRKDSDYAVN